MNLTEAKRILEIAEPNLEQSIYVIIHTFIRNDKKLHLAITDRFRKKCKKGRVWKSKEMLTALKNSEYGFDEKHAYSPGGSDGIFIVTKDYKPKNQMMFKLFDHYIEKSNSGIDQIATSLGVTKENLLAVRVVSHHMRLLGLLSRIDEEIILILVDYDYTK